VLNLAYGAPMAWPTSTGEDRYRRGMYTFWKRSAPYPEQTTFDQPTGENSCVRRVRSNTPLQALTTLNDAVYLECAKALGMRIVKEGGNDDRSRAVFGFRLCTGRLPDAAELKQLLTMVDEEKNNFENNTVRAIKVAAVDPNSLPENVNLHKVAEWTMVARVLLNLDETITKE
jgi:hypothetical protein